MKKVLKAIGIVFGCLLVLVVVALFLVSPIAKSYLEKHDKELLGRELSIEKLKVNVLAGKLKVKNLILFEDDEVNPFVHVDELETKIKLRDLLHNQVTVKRLQFCGLKLKIEQDHSWFNFNSLRDHFSKDTEEESSESSYKVLIEDILIDRSIFRYVDLAVGSDFLLTNLTMRIPAIDLSTLNTNVGLDLCIGDSAVMHTQLQLLDNAKNYHLDLKVNNLALNVIEPYLKQSWAVDSLKGRANLDLQAEGSTEHILDADLQGSIAMHDLSLQDAQGFSLGVVDTVYADINRLNLNNKLLDFGRLYLSGVQSEYITYPDHSTNFDIAANTDPIDADTTVVVDSNDTIVAEFTEAKEQKPWEIVVEDLCLDHSRLFYADSTLPEPFLYEVSELQANASNFNLDGVNNVRLQATLNQSGRLEASWKGDLNDRNNQNLSLMLSNVKFSDFSPYSIQMFGYPLENGTFSFRSQNMITDGQLNGINKLQIADPKVGDKWDDFEPQMKRIPLKLGVYLLTDKNDNVQLDLPIAGNLNDPEFSYRKMAMDALGNIVSKVATAPFRKLSSDEDNRFLSFDLSQRDFTAKEYSKLDNMAALLIDKPELVIVFDQKVNFNALVQEFSNLMLQRAFYLSRHPEVDSTKMDYLTNEKIRSIKLNTKEIYAFASQLGEYSWVHSKKDVTDVALMHYGQRSTRLVLRLLERRNEVLKSYLTKVKGLPESQVLIRIPDEQSMREYDKDCCYLVEVKTKGAEDGF